MPCPFKRSGRVNLYQGIPDIWGGFVRHMLLKHPTVGNLCGQVDRVGVTHSKDGKSSKFTLVFNSASFYFKQTQLNRELIWEYFILFYQLDPKSFQLQVLAEVDGRKRN